MNYTWAAIIPIGFIIAFVVVVLVMSAEDDKKGEVVPKRLLQAEQVTGECACDKCAMELYAKACAKPVVKECKILAPVMPSTIPRMSYHEITA